MNSRSYKKPDLNAPRQRKRVMDLIAYPQKDDHGFFASLKTQHPQLSCYSNLEIASWIDAYCRLLARDVADTREGIELPNGIGIIMAGLCRPTLHTAKVNIDHKTSGQLGIAVPYNNLHTDGYLAKIFFFSKLPGCKFKPCRVLSRTVASSMKSDGARSKYIVDPAPKKKQRNVKPRKPIEKKSIIVGQEIPTPQCYDEFDLS